MLASRTSQPRLVACLLAHNADCTQKNTKGLSALAFAANKKDPACARLLVAAGAPLNEADHFGYTPFMNSISHHQLKTACVLLDARANPDTQTHNGSTALMIALRGKNSSTIECVLNRQVDLFPLYLKVLQ